MKSSCTKETKRKASRSYFGLVSFMHFYFHVLMFVLSLVRVERKSLPAGGHSTGLPLPSKRSAYAFLTSAGWIIYGLWAHQISPRDSCSRTPITVLWNTAEQLGTCSTAAKLSKSTACFRLPRRHNTGMPALRYSHEPAVNQAWFKFVTRI